MRQIHDFNLSNRKLKGEIHQNIASISLVTQMVRIIESQEEHLLNVRLLQDTISS